VKEIAPGLWHWTTFHEGIGVRVSSYLVVERKLAFAIDPRVPEEGLRALTLFGTPRHAYLTNRLHWRHSSKLARELGTAVHVHRRGLHGVPRGQRALPFEWGVALPGGVHTVEIASLCPEETAYFLPSKRVLALGDSVIRDRLRGPLAFVDDELMGDDAVEVKRGLLAAFERVLELDWEHLLLAHGHPIVGRGKAELARFMADSKRLRRAA
jgi:hypothetical protein